ncbi:MAG: antitoxin [Chlorobi bacterium]|nr:antitoxin [Chlorobiota bacterium]
MEKLNKYEKELEASIAAGEWKSVKNVKSKINEYSEIAKNTLKKDKRINIRLSERDLLMLKAKAVEEGIPYQTLITSVLHKYLSGKYSIQV